MRLVSFDVGIKNMAYCLFDVSGTEISILGWEVVPLLNNPVDGMVAPICGCTIPAKTKKGLPTLCKKSAKYKKDERTFCQKHAENSDFLLPTKEGSQTHLKKLTISDLNTIITKHSIPFTKSTKAAFIDAIHAFFSAKCLEPIVLVKAQSAKEVDLVDIGKTMKRKFIGISGLNEGVTNVIIENQISPIANRMKTIQGMLAQYFIMKYETDVRIEFISSINKLKSFTPLPQKPDGENPDKKTTQNDKYKKHKVDAITICREILDKNTRFSTWNHVFDTKKKDDLADCFLQGIWYLKKHNIYLDS
jgi:hypothetical protein